MKIISLILIMLTCISLAFAETIYEKQDDLTLKTTTSISTDDIKTYTISELLTLKARKLEEIKNNQENYLTKDAILKTELAEIEKLIIEADKLGIKEIVPVEIIP